MNEKETDKLIIQYLKYCRYEKGLSEKTIKAYRIDLTQFSIYLGKSLLKCGKGNIQSYLSELYGQYKVKSVKRKIASLKAFYNYLECEEIIEQNPFVKLRVKLHEPFMLPKTIPLTNIDQILQCAYKTRDAQTSMRSYSYKSNLRDIAILELLFATGMRVSELCSISTETIDMNNVTIRIYGKGAKERIIQIGNPDVRAAVEKYYEAFSEQIQGTGWLFVNRLGNHLSDQSVRNMINGYATRAGIEQHITPHMFRHPYVKHTTKKYTAKQPSNSEICLTALEFCFC